MTLGSAMAWKPGEEDSDGVPMLRVVDIGDGTLSGTRIVTIDPKLSAAFGRTVLESGDILLAVMATVGRCTVVPEHLVGANVNRALAVIKPARILLSKYIELAIRSPRGSKTSFRPTRLDQPSRGLTSQIFAPILCHCRRLQNKRESWPIGAAIEPVGHVISDSTALGLRRASGFVSPFSRLRLLARPSGTHPRYQAGDSMIIQATILDRRAEGTSESALPNQP